jgi:hypothetical protein
MLRRMFWSIHQPVSFMQRMDVSKVLFEIWGFVHACCDIDERLRRQRFCFCGALRRFDRQKRGVWP